MNKTELKAITMIANKMNWMHKPVCETIETIKQMVHNQQALEYDTVGECDNFEETLLSIALWDHDKIVSTMYVSDYESLLMWNVQCFCDDMGITLEDFSALQTWNSKKDLLLLEEMEKQEEEEYYYNMIYDDVHWMNHHC